MAVSVGQIRSQVPVLQKSPTSAVEGAVAATPSQTAPKAHSTPSFFNERYVQQLRQEAEKGDVTLLLKWMERFAEGKLGSLLQRSPNIVGAFSDLMLEQVEAGKVPRRRAHQVITIFRVNNIYSAVIPKNTALLLCRDGQVEVNKTIFSLYSDFFKEWNNSSSSSSSSS
ncbi:MAG TPA: hypothetical protein VN457_05190, partial [Chlamydiales bacterium]|nr:hypothetical protein [Chlamydiales bacterium]